MKRILVVEDDTVLANGLKINIDNNDSLVDIASTGKEALEKIELTNYDLALLDVNLPDIGGFELCKKIKTRKSIPVIFLTARDMEIDEVTGFNVGADDYIKKPFSFSVLQRRMAVIMERTGKNKEQDVWSDGNITIDFETFNTIVRGEKIVLTSFEYKILKFFIKNKNVVLTRNILLEKLWYDGEVEVYEHALTVSINRLRNKLESNDKKYIKTVYGMGYTWIGELES